MRPKKRKPRVRTNIYLDPDQKAALQKLSASTRVKLSDYVREGIDYVLAKYKKELRGGRKK